MRNSTYGKHFFFLMVAWVVKLFHPRYTVEGKEHVSGDHPVVFVANHMKVKGPVVVLLYFPFQCRPWVIHHMIKMGDCMDYLESRFIREVMRIGKRPLSRIIAFFMALFCTKFMKAVRAIPTYRGSQKAKLTFQETIACMEKGQNILIFPENTKIPHSEHLYDFFRGFAHLGRKAYRRSGIQLEFHPVFLDRAHRKIFIMKAETFHGNGNFKEERERIVTTIRDLMAEKAAGGIGLSFLQKEGGD